MFYITFYCCTVNRSRHNYFLANKSLLFYRCLFVYIIKRTLHGGLKIWILFFRGKNNSLLTRCARSLNIVLPLENKIDIFAPPCNILYISYLQDMIISRDTCFDHHHLCIAFWKNLCRSWVGGHETREYDVKMAKWSNIKFWISNVPK